MNTYTLTNKNVELDLSFMDDRTLIVEINGSYYKFEVDLENPSTYIEDDVTIIIDEESLKLLNELIVENEIELNDESVDCGQMLRELISLRSEETGITLDEDFTCELIDYLMSAIDNTFESYI